MKIKCPNCSIGYQEHTFGGTTECDKCYYPKYESKKKGRRNNYQLKELKKFYLLHDITPQLKKSSYVSNHNKKSNNKILKKSELRTHYRHLFMPIFRQPFIGRSTGILDLIGVTPIVKENNDFYVERFYYGGNSE